MGAPQGHAQQVKLVVQTGRCLHYTTTSLIFKNQKIAFWALHKARPNRSSLSSSLGAVFTTQRPPWFLKIKKLPFGHSRRPAPTGQACRPGLGLFSLHNDLLDFLKSEKYLLGTPQGQAQQVKLVVQSWGFFHYTTTSLIFKNQKITFWQLKRYFQKGNNSRKREKIPRWFLKISEVIFSNRPNFSEKQKNGEIY